MAEADLAFVDLEMTGLDPELDRVVEICIERVVGGEVVSRLSSLVRPDDGRVGSEHIHGIHPEMLASAPSFSELADDVLRILEGAIVAAHGAKWDVAFLEAELERAGRAHTIPYSLDTLTLSRRSFGFRSHSLSSLARELSIEAPRAHRADADVLVLRQVFDAVVRELGAATPRDLWHVKLGAGYARPMVMEVIDAARISGEPVELRYRPSGRGPQELSFVVTAVARELDPPRVFGYQLPSRSRRELRADRILGARLASSPISS
jgi:DNA polymerase III subunit epsilon